MLSFQTLLLANFIQDFLAKPKCQDTNLRRKLDLFQKLKMLENDKFNHYSNTSLHVWTQTSPL